MDRISPPILTSPAEEAAAQAKYRSVDIEQWLKIYEQMLKIRHFEETVNELYKSARMPGLAHLYCGEEAIAVGVCETLKRYRLHHQHASRPRSLSGQRCAGRPDVRRAAWQSSRLLQRQRRFDAYRRSGKPATWAQMRL